MKNFKGFSGYDTWYAYQLLKGAKPESVNEAKEIVYENAGHFPEWPDYTTHSFYHSVDWNELIKKAKKKSKRNAEFAVEVWSPDTQTKLSDIDIINEKNEIEKSGKNMLEAFPTDTSEKISWKEAVKYLPKDPTQRQKSLQFFSKYFDVSKINPFEKLTNFWSVRLENPANFKRFATKKIGKQGVIATIGFPTKGGGRIQRLLFPFNKFPLKSNVTSWLKYYNIEYKNPSTIPENKPLPLVKGEANWIVINRPEKDFQNLKYFKTSVKGVALVRGKVKSSGIIDTQSAWFKISYFPTQANVVNFFKKHNEPKKFVYEKLNPAKSWEDMKKPYLPKEDGDSYIMSEKTSGKEAKTLEATHTINRKAKSHVSEAQSHVSEAQSPVREAKSFVRKDE